MVKDADVTANNCGVGTLTFICTQKALFSVPIPKITPDPLRNFQFPLYVLAVSGALRSTEISTVCPGATFPERAFEAGPPIESRYRILHF